MAQVSSQQQQKHNVPHTDADPENQVKVTQL